MALQKLGKDGEDRVWGMLLNKGETHFHLHEAPDIADPPKTSHTRSQDLPKGR